MDRIQAMQMFMRVAEAGSFVRAAETLSLPASTVTSTIKNLEKYLKVRLLNRTTKAGEPYPGRDAVSGAVPGNSRPHRT
ncbi:transcription regulator protein of MDR efflux pump cluster [Klebsiella pneumoniae]|uniref:Transcription regulator protein of MDR efflux pump cluster n=1 Tax=Klebsiella pneumoniae TaxID=573 RepID=A0A377U0W8_KLEPN|nr:transcription regulator protein of MDR efflux pump cluster [Klebsiella pneumoniae]